MKKSQISIINSESIAVKIHTIRGVKVMLDNDLAFLYGVETRVLNQSVKRNKKRFPSDFMFKLNYKEYKNLMSQIVISSSETSNIAGISKYGGRRKLPYAFTENGVAMLSSILRSDKSEHRNYENFHKAAIHSCN